MDYRFLLVTDIEIILIVSGWIIATYCIFKAFDGVGKKIAMLLLTPLVTLWIPATILEQKVQDPTMYDYYRASITYNIDNAYTADYYSHIDNNGIPDNYALRINDGMSKIDDNIATVGRNHGFGVPDKPGYETLNEHIKKQYFSLFIDSMYGLHGAPLWSLLLYCLIIYGLSWYAAKTAKLYPIKDQTEEYKELQEKIKVSKEEFDDLNNKIDILNRQISEKNDYKEKQSTAMNREIADKIEKIKKLDKEIEKKIAESNAFDDD